MFKKYIRDDDLVEINSEGTKTSFAFAFYPEFYRDPETSKYLARFSGFRGQVGVGESQTAALQSLRGVFQAYVEVFLETRGLEAFESWLQTHGFELLGADELVEDWAKGDRVSFKVATV